MNNLNLKSGYSFFASLLSPYDILQLSLINNSKIISIFDCNSMFAYQELTRLAKINNLKMLYGVEVDLCYHLNCHKICLLAKNESGYKNICQLSRIISSYNFSSIEFADIKPYLIDCIIIIPSISGYLNNEDYLSYLQELSSINPDICLGLELNDLRTVVRKECGLKKIPFNLINCLSAEDEMALKVLKSTSSGITVKEIKEKVHFEPLDNKEYNRLFSLEEQENLQEVIDKCDVDITKFRADLVSFPLENKDKESYFRELTYKGLYKRLNNRVSKQYKERLEFELEIIIKMGFIDYFLVVWDYVKFAKRNKILVGPGRGSAASSLVSYVLGITNIDPLQYNLLFERFLNPERITMPDIDIDFLDTRREEIVQYLIDKYGKYQTVHVIAFQTYGVKQSVRDAARAYGLTPREIDIFAKRIPKTSDDSTLENIYNLSANFKEFIDGREIYTAIYHAACRIKGLPRQTTLHAAGIVIANEELDNIIPIYTQSEGVICVQCDMNYLEENGLLKMDILALKNLTIIQDILDYIEKTDNNFNLTNISLSDNKIFEQFSRGETIGIFQFESSGMVKALKTIQPNCFNDLTACIALYRPGPMDQIEEYAMRKLGKHQTHYLHNDLIPILQETYGIIIYQEQIILILTKMAGFSLGRADIVRRAITKKKYEIIEQIKTEFIDGCKSNDYNEKIANDIFALIVKFANYGFNKAHSVAYALISYQMAYLKYYFPLPFYCAFMNTFGGAVEGNSKFYELVNIARNFNINLCCPDINLSIDKFIVIDNNIYYPLTFIKGLTNLSVKKIVEERSKSQFKHFLDFVVRMVNLELKQIELLVMAGAFDAFKTNRTTLLANIDSFIQYAKLVSNTFDKQPFIDFSLCPLPNPILLDANRLEELNAEYTLLGMFISDFPLTSMRPKLTQEGYQTIVKLRITNSRSIRLIVFLLEIRTLKTKDGKVMAVIKVGDETGICDLVLYAEAYEKYGNKLAKNIFLAVRGYVKIQENISLIVNEVNDWEVK